MIIESQCKLLGDVAIPEKTGTRIMMMPFVIGDLASLPNYLAPFYSVVNKIGSYFKQHINQVGYLTIDSKKVKKGKTHRRPGPHVDGVYRGSGGGWGGGGVWGGGGNGFVLASSQVGCSVWEGVFEGEIGDEGECDLLVSQLKNETPTRLLAHKA